MVKTVMADWNLLERRKLGKGVVAGPERIKAFIQARMTSSRLPNKIYRQINGAPMLFHAIARAKEAKMINDVIVISPHRLPELPEGIKEFIFNGFENDVLGRYAAALIENPCDYVVRLTSDCPLLDPFLIDFVVSNSVGFDYGSNVLTATFPDGLDVEVMSAQTLHHLDRTVHGSYDREHVTTWIRNNSFIQSDMNLVDIQSIRDYSYLKLSVDDEADLQRISQTENLWERRWTAILQ